MTLDLEKAEKSIKNAWKTGIFSGTINLVLSLIQAGIKFFTDNSAIEFLLSSLTDVALIYGLTFGIYKNSRTCAVLIFVYTFAKIVLSFNAERITGLPIISLVFLYFYFQGIRGTFAYHKLKLQKIKGAVSQ